MPEPKKLLLPTRPDIPPLEVQIHDLCCEAIREAGGYLVDHPEENATVVVMGSHQYEVVVRRLR